MKPATRITSTLKPLTSGDQESRNFRFLDYEQLVIRESEGFQIIPFGEIINLEADSNYTRIHLNNGRTLIQSKTMKYYESKLNDLFLRVHHGHIVNLSYLTEYRFKENKLVLRDGKVLPVSRSRKKSLAEVLAD